MKKVLWTSLARIVNVAVTSTFVMVLWNDAVPSLFSGPSLTWFRSVEVVLIVSLLRGVNDIKEKDLE